MRRVLPDPRRHAPGVGFQRGREGEPSVTAEVRQRDSESVAASPDLGPARDLVSVAEAPGSFPARAVTVTTAVAGVLAVQACLVARRWGRAVIACTAALLWVAGAGVSSAYLGMSWTPAILGAWALGATWGAVLLTAWHTGSRLQHPNTPAAVRPMTGPTTTYIAGHASASDGSRSALALRFRRPVPAEPRSCSDRRTASGPAGSENHGLAACSPGGRFEHEPHRRTGGVEFGPPSCGECVDELKAAAVYGQGLF